MPYRPHKAPKGGKESHVAFQGPLGYIRALGAVSDPWAQNYTPLLECRSGDLGPILAILVIMAITI